ncbi:MAG: hypothetical protein BroJett013_30160 [Alphaproteobacteria bacterium]|nr:MAG: hypothetical protein BroJett013_30160 [Alphaproteobacteria bacterium]
MKRKAKTPAQRARKQAGRYLTPITDAAGATIGYRFAPGPHLRAKGARSQILKYDNGRYMSFDDAKRFRDAAIGGRGEAAPAPARVEVRTLRALWRLYEETKAAEIALNAELPPDKRDEDAIKPATLRFYRSMIQPWLKFAGDEPAEALDAETIKAEYKNQKTQRGHNAAHASYRALLALLAFGKSIKWLAANEAKGLGLARPHGRLRLGTPDEIKALVEAADAIAELDTLAGASGRVVADAIVAALWTGQRQQDLLACDLGCQLRNGFLIFARTAEGDYSQQKVRGRVDQGGQANVKLLPPLKLRLKDRVSGPLIPAPHGGRWNENTFRHAFGEVRAAAAKTCASVVDLQFRDLRDTAVTRLHLAGVSIANISLWTGHSLKTIEQILEEHYLVSTRESAELVGDQIEAWRKRTGVQW